MAATIRTGNMGPLGVTSVRPAGSVEGSMLQHPHAMSIEAMPEVNNKRVAFDERVGRVFVSPFAPKPDMFEVKSAGAEKDYTAESTRDTTRKLQEDSEDECESAVTVTSERYSDAEGCYELSDNGYYISSDNGHIIAELGLAEGTETEMFWDGIRIENSFGRSQEVLKQEGVEKRNRTLINRDTMLNSLIRQVQTEPGWIYGTVEDENTLSQLVVDAVCFFEDTSVFPGEADIWLCEVDGNGTIFEEVEAEVFSTSCGCFTTTEEPTTFMPTEAGTHGDTPAPSAEATMTTSMTDEPTTPMPTEAGTHGADTPAPSAEETNSMTDEPATPMPTEAGTHGEDTPAPSGEATMTTSMTEEPATPIPTEAGTHEGDTPAPTAGSRVISSMTNESTVSPSPSPSHMTHIPTSPTVAPTHGPQALYPTHAPTQTTHNPSFTSMLTPTSTPTSMSSTHFPTSMTMSPTHAQTSAIGHAPSSSMSPVGATPVPSHGDRGIDGSSMAPSGGPTLGGFDPANTGSTMFPKMSILGTVGACIVVVLVGSVIQMVS